ncbi:MAG: transglutaminase family protein [Actinomycetota bacterium]|nr:transglutaminase family protein [Actinomycetota bacterium]
MKYRVAHTTAYHYQEEVSCSFGQIHLLPRDDSAQRCERSEVVIDPEPHDFRERSDFFGNRVAYFEIGSTHRRLCVSTTSWIEVVAGVRQASVAAVEAAGIPWEAARLDGAQPKKGELLDLEGVEFVLDSPLVATGPALAAYGRSSFTDGRPLVEALRHLTLRVYTDFTFKPGATLVTTTAREVLEKREGVCQDFAHLVIGCMRSVGLAARYVSGYLETDPPPGRPRLQGADVSHAWASVLVPGMGWIDIDPTNKQLVNDRYVVTAWGRDYGDVPPLKGVIFTEGTKHDLEVMVDVVRED